MKEPVEGRYRNSLMGLLTACTAGGIALMTGWFALTLTDVDLNRQAWLLKVAVFGPEPVGIFQADERFGWIHSPAATGRQRVVPDFDVQYHIDPFGHRLTPNSPPPGVPVVLFLGGSFTFGEGVADDESYPAILQGGWPNFRVVNAAVNGCVTIQALFALEREIETNNQIVLIVYGFITHHQQRNYLRRSWLDLLMDSEDRRNPYFEIEGTKLIFKGLAEPVVNGLPDNPELARREALMTQILLEVMAKRCAERGIPFVVAYLPDGSQDIGMNMLSRGVRPENVIDLRPLLDFDAIHFKHDIHLHAEGHRQVANLLRPLLEARLSDRF